MSEENKKSLILIVEDDDINCKYLERILKRISEIDYLTARNGREAVDISNGHNDISLVFMDVKMPVMDGYTATKIIKEKYPDLPIVAVTAFAMLHDRQNALAAGCDDHISKPYEPEVIRHILQKFHII